MKKPVMSRGHYDFIAISTFISAAGTLLLAGHLVNDVTTALLWIVLLVLEIGVMGAVSAYLEYFEVK